MKTPLNRARIMHLLSSPSPAEEEQLRDTADRVRAESVGDEVHLRGLIEFSNECVCSCLYCGLRVQNRAICRYRMTGSTILESARLAAKLGYGTVVLQSGEDPALDAESLADTIRAIKRETGLAVTLSLGELDDGRLRVLRAAGADRYLLKFETSNRAFYRKLRPGRELEGRLERIEAVRRAGYQVGSGTMAGLPGQTVEDLVEDLLLLQKLDLDMASVGPFIPCEHTPLAADTGTWPAEQRVRTTLRMIALLRIMCPELLIPATTSLATLDAAARPLALRYGANVVMPNVGPAEYRRDYVIYPGKADVLARPEDVRERVMAMLKKAGRRPGAGPGHSARTRMEVSRNETCKGS